jgi:NAD(P)-dependent dehydrogenase (short-subunit alcohol dehydrogenase family)
VYNPFDLKDRLYVVTGAASGIGRACCERISQLSGRVVAVDINEKGLQETLHALEGSGHSSKVVDLADRDLTEVGLVEISHAIGQVSGVVHAAGMECIQPLRLLQPSRYRQAMAVNLEAALMLIREYQTKGTYPEAGGSVVLISSVVAVAGSPGAAAYGMMKSGLTGLCRSAAMELAPRGIRVNCVAPGYVDTAMFRRLSERWTPEQKSAVAAEHPLGIGNADDIAHAVIYLLADTGRWITGTTLTVDGGFSAR